MGTSKDKKTKIFNGAGYLIGFAIGTAVAVLFVAISGVEALIGAIAVSISIPLGIGLEKSFQINEPENKSSGKNYAIASIALGLVFLAVFIVLYF
jgi:uncharacterized membrane protein